MKKEQKKHRFNAVDAIIIILIAAVIGVAVFFFREQNNPDGENLPSTETTTDEEKETAQIEYVVDFKYVRNDIFVDRAVIVERESLGENYHLTKEDVLVRIKEGDAVKEVGTLRELGEIVKVEVSPATYTGTDKINGQPVLGEYPGCSNIRVTISTEATLGNLDRCIIGEGFELYIGVGVNIRVPNFTASGSCTEIRIIGGGEQ